MLAVLTLPPRAHGQSAWFEGFEGPDVSWRDAGGNAQYRIHQHARVQGQAHTGDGCERLTVLGNHGTYVHIAHEAGRPRVIEDLVPSVWVRSDRPGLQIAARLALPRTEDPRTGRPVSTLVRGSTYSDVGRWQQLRIADVPRLLARQVRVLRTQLGPAVDGREAYVDSILLNVYGGPGKTNVWIDDLDVAGYVAAPEVSAVPPSGQPSLSGRPSPSGNPATSHQPMRRRVELALSVLMVDGRPRFPRIIRHRGEPLALLRQLGFNTVWLDRPASLELLQEAAKLDLWLICPPPRVRSSYLPSENTAPLENATPLEDIAPLEEVGPEYSHVLAWDLGSGLGARQLDSTRALAKQIRLADHRQARPLICRPATELRAYSRHVDLLLIGRQPLGTSLELKDYTTWVRRQSLLAPGTTVWTTIQTQPTAALRQQLAALEPDRPPPLSVGIQQIRRLAYAAISAGSRGLLFESESPLSANDPETRQRAMSLECLNLELQPIEPWAAGGSFATTPSRDHPELLGTVLRGNRSLLLLPIWSAPGAQFVVGQSAPNSVSLVVPGVPDDAKAYQLRPGGLQPLWPKRVPGGTRITLDELGLAGQVLFSQDPWAIETLARHVASIGPRAARLRRDLAARELHVAQQVAGQIARRSTVATQSASSIDAARHGLQRCDGYLAARDYPAAWLHAGRALRSLQPVEWAHWRAAVEPLTSPLSSPAAASFATLPAHWRLVDRINQSRLGPNAIAGGDLEDLPTMLAAGWNHFQHCPPDLQCAADLIADAARSGNCGLRLTVAALDPENPPAVVRTAPLWVTSPPVSVEAGQLVCIHGWVHVPAPITGSVDGLLIIDSLAGEALAQRIGQTSGWQQFTLYRAAPASGKVTVTFALSGLGEVRLDDVAIHRLLPAAGGMTLRAAPGTPPR